MMLAVCLGRGSAQRCPLIPKVPGKQGRSVLGYSWFCSARDLRSVTRRSWVLVNGGTVWLWGSISGQN